MNYEAVIFRKWPAPSAEERVLVDEEQAQKMKEFTCDCKLRRLLEPDWEQGLCCCMGQCNFKLLSIKPQVSDGVT